MFHPVGSRPSSVYWRRRLIMLAAAVAVIVLLALTVHALTSNGSTPIAAGTATHAPHHTKPAGPTTHAAGTTPPATTPTTPAGSTSASTSASDSTATPAACTSAGLHVTAATDAHSYKVGDQPVLSMVITNTGAQPCVQNLADSQILLTVYNGAARVWGSHDCQVQPGTDDRTLAVGAPVKVSIPWSGLSSQPNCAGTRQLVGAGTYTLYPTLSGAKGQAAQFAIR